MKSRKLPSPRLMRALLAYDAETGHLFWKPRPAWLFAKGFFSRKTNSAKWNTRYAGKRAFTARKSVKGHMKGSVFYIQIPAHRVAWVLHYGEWPLGVIDHINQNPLDNRIENLRDTSHRENMLNCQRSANNTSGVTGVTYDKARKKWVAQICLHSQTHHLGRFECIAAAACARAIADKEYGFHNLHGRAA